jgi:NADH-quinone oxidoreductase subunit M
MPIAAIVGAIGVVLGAVYMLGLVRNMFFGPLSPRWATLPDMTGGELATIVPLVLLRGAAGVVPHTVPGTHRSAGRPRDLRTAAPIS